MQEKPDTRELEKAYSALPNLECRQRCGPRACARVLAHRVEHERMLETSPNPAASGHLCPFYCRADGLCLCYQARPLICRLWGCVDHPTFRCPEGCEPDRWLSLDEAFAIMRALYRGNPLTVGMDGKLELSSILNPDEKDLVMIADVVGDMGLCVVGPGEEMTPGASRRISLLINKR